MTYRYIRATINHTVEFEGVGLHSGEPVSVKVHPSDTTLTFRYGSERVRAEVANVTGTSRCTRLGPVSTVEHIMSAFAGLGVTDAEIELSADELPALDGAAALFTKGLKSAGLKVLGEAECSLFERVFYSEDLVRIGIAPGSGHWRFDFESGDRWPNSQSFECSLSPDVYETEIAPARTFAFEEEVAPLRAAGLAKGLDISTALILGKEGFENEAKWPDEPARHKLLDLIGDLYLSGVPPVLLSVVAVRSGHRANVEAAKKLAAHVRFSGR